MLFGKHDNAGQWRTMRLSGAGSSPGAVRSVAFGCMVAVCAWRERPRLIVSTHVNFGPVARLLRRMLAIPYVLVAHGIDVHSGLSSARRRALVEADRVWAVSAWTASRLRSIGVPAASISIVPNTYADDVYVPGPAESALRDRYGRRVRLTRATTA
jgi:glycosyltransferase involved in cell wall biosynthesis